MAAAHINRVVGQLRRAALGDDGALLERFVVRRDPAAFEALLRRHGPMVLGVCRRVLGNAADAEDAFQATFLVLVRKAASVVPRDRVGNWLYGVACRTAMKARAMNGKRRAREHQAGRRTPAAPEAADAWPDLQAVLDEELERLPEKYRAPVVLCDLEGKTHREAARLLGWPDGTLSTRLTAARRLLAGRLTRRGLALSAGAVAALVAQNAAAGVPSALAQTTLHAATGGGGVSAQVVALTEGVLKAMLIAKLKTVTAVVLGLVLLGAGATGLTYSGDQSVPGAGDKPAEEAPALPRAATGAKPKEAAADRPAKGTIQQIGVVQQVTEFGTVRITLSHEYGVKAGQLFEVYRLKPQPSYLGKVKVVEVAGRACVAQALQPYKGIVAGDLVAESIRPAEEKPSAGQAGDVPHGTVTAQYAGGLYGVSLGHANGASVHQELEVYRSPPKAGDPEQYVGRLRVMESHPDRCLALFLPHPLGGPADDVSPRKPIVGDRVVVAEPRPTAKKDAMAASGARVEEKPAASLMSVRHAAELFLLAVQAGKTDAARSLAVPELPQSAFDLVRNLGKPVPPLAHVQEATSEALAISEPAEMTVNGQTRRGRFVIVLKRWSPNEALDGWVANGWRVAEVHAYDADAALTSLIGFLRRHPAAQPAPPTPSSKKVGF